MPLEILRRTWRKRVRGRFWSSGKAYMSSNRRAFQAQLASQTSRRTQETPQTPPRRVWNNWFFLNFWAGPKVNALTTCNLLTVPLSRFAREGDGEHRSLTVSYRYTKNDHYGAGCLMTSSCLPTVSCNGPPSAAPGAPEGGRWASRHLLPCMP